MGESNKSVFERLDDITDGQSDILNEIRAVKEGVIDKDAEIKELKARLHELEKGSTNTASTSNKTNAAQLNEKEQFSLILSKSDKGLKWFGNKKEFQKSKKLLIIFTLALLLIGVINTVLSCMCFKTYSTFTLFENIWMIIALIILVKAGSIKQIIAIPKLEQKSIYKYETDNIGMPRVRNNKVHIVILRWLAYISVACNIICIWTSLGKQLQLVSTILEIVFFILLIVSFFFIRDFFSQYVIIWVEYCDAHTKGTKVFVYIPFAKKWMSYTEARKTVPMLFD